MSENRTVQDVIAFLEVFAPPVLAEEWDNVGLLLGDRGRGVVRIMTCLTLTPDVAAEAIDRGADLVVTHHPILFRPVQRLTGDTAEGRLLLDLAAAGIGVYSPHTAFDSAAGGINRQLAERLGLSDIRPLRPAGGASESGIPGSDSSTMKSCSTFLSVDAPGQSVGSVGGGRYGALPAPIPLTAFLAVVREALGVKYVPYVGELDRSIRTVAVACGAAAEYLGDACRLGCDVLLTGEARFHACLEAREAGIALVLAGHYATERPAVESLAAMLAAEWTSLSVWASQRETDPVHWSV